MKADPSVKIFFLLETLSDHGGSFGIEKLILEVRFDLKALNMVHGRRGLWWWRRGRVLAYGDLGIGFPSLQMLFCFSFPLHLPWTSGFSFSFLLFSIFHFLLAIFLKVPRPGGEPGIFLGFLLFSLS